MPKPTPDQLVKINQFTQVPLEEDRVYVFKDMMIDDQETSYHSIIHENLLTKFMEDARKGVALLTNHNNRQLPVGRSFDAELHIESTEDGRPVRSLYGHFYIDLGRNTQGGMTTDDIARGIDAGTIFDTSIGFSAKRWDCSICDNDIRDYMKCPHIPGKKYAVTRDGVDVVETCRVIVGRDGQGDLLENSLVYAGACNRASITRGNFSVESASDMENRSKLHLVENFKDIPLDATIYQYYTADGSVLFTDTSERTNGSKELQRRSEQEVELKELLAVLSELGIASDSAEALKAELQKLVDAQSALQAKEAELAEKTEELSKANEKASDLEARLSAKDEQIAALEQANQELSEKAQVAETYRQELITKTVEMGVRLMGNSFNAELFTKFLGTLSLDEIKAQFDSFEQQVNEKFAGARLSQPKAPKRDQEEELYREDFESEEEFGNYIAAKAEAYVKENPGTSLAQATKMMMKKYSKKESE